MEKGRGGSLIIRSAQNPLERFNVASTAVRHGYQAAIDICEGKKEKKRNTRSRRKRRGKFLKRSRRGEEDGE